MGGTIPDHICIIFPSHTIAVGAELLTGERKGKIMSEVKNGQQFDKASVGFPFGFFLLALMMIAEGNRRDGE